MHLHGFTSLSKKSSLVQKRVSQNMMPHKYVAVTHLQDIAHIDDIQLAWILRHSFRFVPLLYLTTNIVLY